MKRAVFLDRDGVLNRAVVRNRKPYAPATPAEVEIMPDAPEALRLLRQRGFLLIIVSNQPDIARGTTTRARVDEIDRVVTRALPVDDLFICPHDDADDTCNCRKPKPGMILDAAKKWDIDVRSSYMIGDRWRDIDAGAAAGCTTILIDYDYDEPIQTKPNVRVKTILDAAEWIIAREVS